MLQLLYVTQNQQCFLFSVIENRASIWLLKGWSIFIYLFFRKEERLGLLSPWSPVIVAGCVAPKGASQGVFGKRATD